MSARGRSGSPAPVGGKSGKLHHVVMSLKKEGEIQGLLNRGPGKQGNRSGPELVRKIERCCDGGPALRRGRTQEAREGKDPKEAERIQQRCPFSLSEGREGGDAD